MVVYNIIWNLSKCDLLFNVMPGVFAVVLARFTVPLADARLQRARSAPRPMVPPRRAMANGQIQLNTN